MRRAVGKMRHRIEIYEPARTPDGAGGFIRGDVKVLDAWAEVKNMSAGEKLKYAALQQELTHKVIMRASDQVIAGRYFKYDGRDFYIKDVIKRGERNEFLELTVREGGPV